MKTFLQLINEFTGEHITMSLQRFFLWLTIVLFSVLILVATVAPFSPWKFISLALLYGSSMVSGLLTYANYQLEALDGEDLIPQPMQAEKANPKIDPFVA